MGVSVNVGQKIGAEINVVPLIDILLVLIIIFMVISPLTPRGLRTVVPQPSANDGPSSSNPIIVQVGAGGQLMINQVHTNWDTLGSDLDAIFKLRAERVAFVRGDDSADFADVARAIDIMRAHGIDKVGLISTKLVPA